jgi:hypothetical protein
MRQQWQSHPPQQNPDLKNRFPWQNHTSGKDALLSKVALFGIVLISEVSFLSNVAGHGKIAVIPEVAVHS